MKGAGYWPTDDHDYELLDDDGYPTEQALDAIRKAPHDQVLRMAQTLWVYDGWTVGGRKESPHHNCSTYGWSGNESVIDAMQDNTLFWAMHWEESKRGGHYKFREKP